MSDLDIHTLDYVSPWEDKAPRKLRPDLTPEELERFQKYGSIEFKSAGATRKR